MKKIFIGLLTSFLVLGGGTFVFAHGNGENTFNFEDMQPYMEEMHPNFSEEDQRAMFNDCHGDGGYMQNNNNEFRGMMNNFQ
ncbi:hypothetical protein GCM10007063_29280 [Lentibacillus kapialis]|uniref:FAD/FMN-containing dehydrogenase n=1 Tax=Lentibacillus kapialis TaxID=340214 RepID=A0A917Q0U5_9BACI|nr:hypothetical protein [Lentibacillus kapialis]GGK05029.1 hypothetical protein GCM10007063_29280 [Lentibacillus kapialis]